MRKSSAWAPASRKMHKLSDIKVLVRGAGEVASGIAYRLHLCGALVCLTEAAMPLAVARGTAFCEAVFNGAKTIMGVRAELVPPEMVELERIWRQGDIPIVVDPAASVREKLKPDVLVDAIMAKRRSDTQPGDAPLVIGIGPGFYAGRDVHVVIESNHSHNLGRVIFEGEAERDTGTPVNIGGLDRERVVWAPEAGIFISNKTIGDPVVAGEILGQVGGRPLAAPLNGMLRGIIRSGVKVSKGSKLIEVDPVHDRTTCDVLTTKMLTIGEGVVKAITIWLEKQESPQTLR